MMSTTMSLPPPLLSFVIRCDRGIRVRHNQQRAMLKTTVFQPDGFLSFARRCLIIVHHLILLLSMRLLLLLVVLLLLLVVLLLWLLLLLKLLLLLLRIGIKCAVSPLRQ